MYGGNTERTHRGYQKGSACGGLGTRREASEKRPPVLVKWHLAGREHWNCLLFPAEGRVKTKALSASAPNWTSQFFWGF